MLFNSVLYENTIANLRSEKDPDFTQQDTSPVVTSWMVGFSSTDGMRAALILLFSSHIFGHLVLEDFFNGSNPFEKWSTDFSGTSGRIGLLHNQDGSLEAISTNVTYCSSSPCYRAELKTPDAQRQSILSSTSGEYWIGISIRIPSTWQWSSNSPQQITCYVFQIHGGDNMGQSPIIGIRNEGSQYRINICGNTALSSSDSICSYYSAGLVRPGQWDHWVIYDKFSYDDTSAATRGSVRVWRNGALVVNANNLLTSYHDLQPHYLKFGSYILQWKTPPVSNLLVDWVGSEYRAIRVGNSSSSYDEVYTGPRYEPTSLPTTLPTIAKVPSPSSSKKDSFMSLYIWIIIGGGGGLLLLVLIFFFCCRGSSSSESKEVNSSPSRGGAATAASSAPQIEMSSAVVVSSPSSAQAKRTGNYELVGNHQNVEEQI
jgi:hypothetical protein